MNNDLLTGNLVYLTAQNPDTDAEAYAKWEHDSEFERLLSVKPILPVGTKAWRERLEEKPEDRFLPFAIRTLADDKLIGFVSLFGLTNQHGDCWVGIGIGDHDYWGKGYGTDAMRIILRYAFQELNRHRVSLNLLSTNERAQRSYEKCGFIPEGRTRETDKRMLERSDLTYMGILRHEWEAAEARAKGV